MVIPLGKIPGKPNGGGGGWHPHSPLVRPRVKRRASNKRRVNTVKF